MEQQLALQTDSARPQRLKLTTSFRQQAADQLSAHRMKPRLFSSGLPSLCTNGFMPASLHPEWRTTRNGVGEIDINGPILIWH